MDLLSFAAERRQRNEVMSGGGIWGQGSIFFPLKITVIMAYLYANRKDPIERKFWCTMAERGDNCRGKYLSWQRPGILWSKGKCCPLCVPSREKGRLWEPAAAVGTWEPSPEWVGVLSETRSRGSHQLKVRERDLRRETQTGKWRRNAKN